MTNRVSYSWQKAVLGLDSSCSNFRDEKIQEREASYSVAQFE